MVSSFINKENLEEKQFTHQETTCDLDLSRHEEESGSFQNGIGSSRYGLHPRRLT